jgi:hypothetical protein
MDREFRDAHERLAAQACLGSKAHGYDFMQFTAQHHGVGLRAKFLEVGRLHVSPVGLRIDIHLKHADATGVVFFRRGVEGEDSRLQHAGLGVFARGLAKVVESGLVDIEFCKSHERCRGRLGRHTSNMSSFWSKRQHFLVAAGEHIRQKSANTFQNMDAAGGQPHSSHI